MADPIYDEEKKPASPEADDLKQQEQAANGDPYKTDYGSDEQRDEGPQDQVAQEHPSQVGRGYRPNKINGQGRFKSLSKRKGLLLAAGASSSLLVIVGILAFLLPSLKVPQLMAHITQYRFVRLTRTYYKQASILSATRISLPEEELKNTKGKVGVKLASLRPQAVIDNMKASGILSFEYEQGRLGVQKIKAVIVDVDGQRRQIAAPDHRFGRSLNNYKERLRFASQIDQAVHDALRGESYFVRSNTSKRLLSAWGIKLVWWEKKAAKYRSLSQVEADRLAQKETYEKIKTRPSAGAKTAGISDAAETADKELAKCLDEPACNDGLRRTGQLPQSVTEKVDDIVNKLNSRDFAGTLLRYVNDIYAIAVPVCIVYDGSINASKTFINSQNLAAIKTFFAVAEVDSQQKKGGINAQALGAFNRQVGDITDSIPERLARNQPVDTSAEISPQTARSGEFSIFDVIFGSSSGVANSLANTFCPILTNMYVAGITGAINVAASLIPGAGQAVKAGERTAAAAASHYIKSVFANIAQKFTRDGRVAFKNTAKQYASSTAKVTAGTEGATYLARMLVLAEMGAFYNGLGIDTMANQADVGAVAYTQELNRQQMFGRPLTNEEVVASFNADQDFIAQQKSRRSNFEKIFALSNPDSIISTLAVRLGETKFSSVANFLINLPKVFGTIFSSIGQLSSARAGAVNDPASVNYNIVQWGWSEEELALIENDDSFDPVINSEIVEERGQSKAIEDEYGKCFSAEIGDLLTGGSLKREHETGKLLDEGLCSPKNLGPNNPNPKIGDNVFRWRIDQSYQSTLDELLGIQNPETSVTTTSSVSPGSTTSTPIAGQCAEGSEDVGTHDGYENYNKIRIKLCAIDGLIIEDFTSGKEGAESTPKSDYYIPGANNRVLVDASVSQKIVDMVRAAKADGVTLKAFSSYRTYEHQKKLASGGGAYAAAGDSKHQRGFAIDFIDSNQNSTANCRNIPGHTVNGRCVAPGDPIWEWLNKNAANPKFGYKQLINESWHWSPDGQ